MARAPIDSPAAGFTILEVVVALLLTAGALAGAGQLMTVSFSLARLARVETSSTQLGIEKLEQLQALAWGYDETGGPRSDLGTDLSVDPPRPGGKGLQPSPAGSLAHSLAGYADYLDIRGDWVGSGDSPPVSASYVRRWSIEPLPDDPADTLVLQVRVLPLPSPSSAPYVPGEVRFTALLTRKSRLP